MGIGQELLGIYKGLSAIELFYINVRIFISPLSRVEEALPENGRIYDVGCGVGLLSNLAALRGAGREMVGIDISEEKIRTAVRSIEGRGNIRFEVRDASNSDFPGADAIVACDLLHHMPHPSQDAFLKHSYDALRSGGVLVVEEIDKRPIYKYLFAIGIDKITRPASPVFYRTTAETERLLKDAGFDVKSKRIDSGYPISTVLFRAVKP